jgi:hypothetical protein
MLLLLSGSALAADLQFSFVTEDGIAEKASWPAFESYTRRLGPQQVGRTSVIYALTVPGSVFDAVQGGYIVDVSVCLEWEWKNENGRFCDPIQLIAKAEGLEVAKFTRTLRDKDKFTYTVEAYWTGEPPAGYVPPAPPPVP